MKERLILVIKTLQDLDIKSTYDNMRKLIACINELDQMVGELAEVPTGEEAEAPAEETVGE